MISAGGDRLFFVPLACRSLTGEQTEYSSDERCARSQQLNSTYTEKGKPMFFHSGCRTIRAIVFLTLVFVFAPSCVIAQERDGVLTKADRTALIERLNGLNHDILSRGMLPFKGADEKLLTGYAYGEFFDWDLYFENVYLSYYGISKFDFSNLRMFLQRQQPDGFVARTLGARYPRPEQMFKPFIAQLVVLGAKQNGDDYSWLKQGEYLKLKKYVDRWFAFDKDGNGLPTWHSADASGMDNQVRRAGQLRAYSDEGVDLACYLVRELTAMAVIADHLGEKADAASYRQHAKLLGKKINDVFWDDKQGFYFDRNERTGKRIELKSVVGFLPLWAGVAPRDRARRLVHEHLMNPNEFWLAYPVATYAKNEWDFYQGSRKGECNWQGPSWVPTNYMVFHGLMDYGYKKEARELAERNLQMALYKNPVTREYYDSQTGVGYGMNPFWGWSSLAYGMLLEWDRKYNPTSLTGTIRPLFLQELGVQFPENIVRTEP